MSCLDKMYAISTYLLIYFLTLNMDLSIDWDFFNGPLHTPYSKLFLSKNKRV